MELYVGCEDVDGYYRDGCVFRNEIDIYDTMAFNVQYNSDVHMTYSLNDFMPYEGFRIGFNGLNGRIDVRRYQRQAWDASVESEVRITKNFGNTEVIKINPIRGEHGGADPKIKDMISMVNNATGNSTSITQYPNRKWDTKKRLLASIELAGKLIDYKPTTKFEDGLKTNMEWFNLNWDKIQAAADFPVGMSSAVRKK